MARKLGAVQAAGIATCTQACSVGTTEAGGRGIGLGASHLRDVWHSIFHLDLPVAEKIVRSILIYAFLVVALRVVGKRELGQANTLDLAVLLLVANAVQNGIIGNDVSVTGAVLGAVTLFLLNALVARGVFHLPRLAEALEGEPTVLIRDGAVVAPALRRELI